MSRLTTLIVVAVALIGCATVVSAARNHIWKATSSKPHPDNVRKLVISVCGWCAVQQAQAWPNPLTSLHLAVQIKQRNVHQLERLVYEVSDPKSSFYGQYLSQDEVTALGMSGYTSNPLCHSNNGVLTQSARCLSFTYQGVL